MIKGYKVFALIICFILCSQAFAEEKKSYAIISKQTFDNLKQLLCPDLEYQMCEIRVGNWVAASYINANESHFQQVIVKRVLQKKRAEMKWTNQQVTEWKENMWSSNEGQKALLELSGIERNLLLREIALYWAENGVVPELSQ